MKILCLCHTCAIKHVMDFDPARGPGAGFGDWISKHPQGHDVDFLWPERSSKAKNPGSGWLDYLDNANVNIAYGTATAATITIASLATSASLLGGQQSASVSNTTNLYLDYLVGGEITVGTSPTSSTSIYVVATGTMDATNWPDGFTGSNASLTVTSAGIFNAICRFVANLTVDSATSNRTYPFPQTSLAQSFGGTIPPLFTFAVLQDTGVNLNSTAANHEIYYQGVYATVV